MSNRGCSTARFRQRWGLFWFEVPLRYLSVLCMLFPANSCGTGNIGPGAVEGDS
jgi:hypothetical protein